MAITTAMIKELRETTGAGILDSKKALENTDGDFDKAVEFLREKGLAKAAKKSSREANEGLVSILTNETGSEASMILVNCETDFVARNDDFKSLVNAFSQQIFESKVASIDEFLASASQAKPGQTVQEELQEAISRIGENIIIRQIIHYRLEGEGLIEGYVHFGGKVGVLVEVGTEATVEDKTCLKELAHDLALHVAAINPPYLYKDDIPEDELNKEREIYLNQLADDNKPDNIKARIVEGRLNKYYKENCLTKQPFVKDDKISIDKLLKQQTKILGTAVTINRFTRYALESS